MGAYSTVPRPDGGTLTTEVTDKASKFLQHILASFIRTPVTGLETEFSWPKWEPNSTSLASLFGDNVAEMEMVDGGIYDTICANPPPIPWDQI
jgi:hypothetical protein